MRERYFSVPFFKSANEIFCIATAKWSVGYVHIHAYVYYCILQQTLLNGASLLLCLEIMQITSHKWKRERIGGICFEMKISWNLVDIIHGALLTIVSY